VTRSARRVPPIVLPGLLVIVLAALLATARASGAPAPRFDRHGLSFVYPRGWFVTTLPLSNGVNPAYRFTVSTTPVRRTPQDDGPCLPGVAAQLPKNAVLAYLREALGADRSRSLPRMPRRPRSFRLPTRADTSLCGFGRGGRWIPFRDAGRAFYLGIYLGLDAPAARARALGRLLDDMRVERS
jgi:hypothetical protein